jgi:RNA polymerase sigma-32 factor
VAAPSSKTSRPSASRKPRGEGSPAGKRGSARAEKPPPPPKDEGEEDQEDEDQEGAETAPNEDQEGEEKDDLDSLEGPEVIEATGELVEESTGGELFDIPLAAPTPADQSLVRLDALQLYMQQIQRHPLLTPTEEKQLTEKYQQTGDVQVAARLVTANLRLVVKLAYEYRRAYRNIMDLIQEGNIGLMQAVRRFDPARGVKLSSYAAWWIRAYMLRYILNNWRLVKLGTTQAQRKLFFNLNREKARLSAMGIEPTHGEIALRLGVEEKDVVEMDRRLASSDASLDATVGDSEGRSTTRMDLLPAKNAGPDVLMEGVELQEIVRARLEEFRRGLQGKELIIFEQRLIAEDPMTLQQLGEQFGVSRERVRQLEARLTGKLRSYLSETLGDAVRVDN